MSPFAARALHPPRLAAPPRLLAICATLLLLLATFTSPALGEPPEGVHCPSEATGAPSGAIEGASGQATVDGVSVSWSGDPGSATLTNTNELPATIDWCAKGGTDFDGAGSMYLEGSTPLTPGQIATAGPFGTEISYLVVRGVTIDTGPEPVDITLVKRWFDADGAATEAPDDDWGVEMTSGSEVVAAVPGDDDTATFGWTYDADRASWVPSSYAVIETALPEGWQEVDCAAVTEVDAAATGTGSGFTATAGGEHLVCNQQLPEDETVSITLVKGWFDAAGDPVEVEPEDGWGLRLYASADEGTDLAVLPGDATAGLEPGARYGVEETGLGEGWEAVACTTVDVDALGVDGIVNEDTSAISGAQPGAIDGTFAATDDGVHLVCNQQVEEVFDLSIAKVWLDDEGTVIDEPEDATWAVTLTIDDQVVASLPGEDDTHTSTEPIDGYTVEEDLPSGWEVVACPADVLAETGAGAEGVGSFDGDADGLHLVCNGAEVEVLPIVITPPPAEAPQTEAPPPRTGEVEVLAEVVSQTSALPRTGGPFATLLPLALMLLAMGLSLVLVTRRHAGGPSV